jgi:hypothetical protein
MASLSVVSYLASLRQPRKTHCSLGHCKLTRAYFNMSSIIDNHVTGLFFDMSSIIDIDVTD